MQPPQAKIRMQVAVLLRDPVGTLISQLGTRIQEGRAIIRMRVLLPAFNGRCTVVNSRRDAEEGPGTIVHVSDAFARRVAGDGRISPDFTAPGILAQSVLFIYRMRMQNNSCLDSVVSMKDVSAI